MSNTSREEGGLAQDRAPSDPDDLLGRLARAIERAEGWDEELENLSCNTARSLLNDGFEEKEAVERLVAVGLEQRAARRLVSSVRRESKHLGRRGGRDPGTCRVRRSGHWALRPFGRTLFLAGLVLGIALLGVGFGRIALPPGRLGPGALVWVLLALTVILLSGGTVVGRRFGGDSRRLENRDVLIVALGIGFFVLWFFVRIPDWIHTIAEIVCVFGGLWLALTARSLQGYIVGGTGLLLSLGSILAPSLATASLYAMRAQRSSEIQEVLSSWPGVGGSLEQDSGAEGGREQIRVGTGELVVLEARSDGEIRPAPWEPYVAELFLASDPSKVRMIAVVPPLTTPRFGISVYRTGQVHKIDFGIWKWPEKEFVCARTLRIEMPAGIHTFGSLYRRAARSLEGFLTLANAP